MNEIFVSLETISVFEFIIIMVYLGGRAEANGGHCHVNWQRVCRPLSLGGLGVRDLERAGLSLRLRWIWFSKTDEHRAWAGLDLQFSDKERDLFFASTSMEIGNGQKALF